MTKKQKEQRDKRDDNSCKMFDNESELKNILAAIVEKYRNEGFTWAEIHFELFKLCNDICYDTEQKEILE